MAAAVRRWWARARADEPARLVRNIVGAAGAVVGLAVALGVGVDLTVALAWLAGLEVALVLVVEQVRALVYAPSTVRAERAAAVRAHEAMVTTAERPEPQWPQPDDDPPLTGV